MKKVFMILATLAVASMTLVGCKKDDNKGGKDQPDQPDQPTVETFEVYIDGSFDDWAALTADKATENDIIFDGCSGAIKAMKATSDEEAIYFYAEVAVDQVQSSDKAIEGGNSNDGHGDATPGPLTIYLDLDGDPTTGFTAHLNGDGDPFVAGVGCEVGNELYLFVDSKDGKCKLGWSQLVYEPDGALDGDVYQAASWWSLDNPNGGWAPDYDNTVPALDSYKTAVGGGVVKIEWAIERGHIAQFCKRGHDMGNTIIIGATYNNAGTTGSFSYGNGIADAETLKLR